MDNSDSTGSNDTNSNTDESPTLLDLIPGPVEEILIGLCFSLLFVSIIQLGGLILFHDPVWGPLMSNIIASVVTLVVAISVIDMYLLPFTKS